MDLDLLSEILPLSESRIAYTYIVVNKEKRELGLSNGTTSTVPRLSVSCPDS